MNKYIDAIDRVQLIRDILDKYGNTGGTEDANKIYRMILNQPTANVRENVRAERLLSGQTTSKYDIDVTNWYECSACGGAVDEYDNFCKHCGADMRGSDE